MWKLYKLVRDYIRTRNIKNKCNISWEDVKVTTGAPFSAIEIKQKFSNYLAKNSKGKRYITFEKKIRLLENNQNICKISPPRPLCKNHFRSLNGGNMKNEDKLLFEF